MYLCMYAYVYIYIYVCTYIYIYICMSFDLRAPRASPLLGIAVSKTCRAASCACERANQAASTPRKSAEASPREPRPSALRSRTEKGSQNLINMRIGSDRIGVPYVPEGTRRRSPVCPPPEGGRFHTAGAHMYSSSGGLARVQPDSVVGVDVNFLLDESTNRNGSCVARRPFW